MSSRYWGVTVASVAAAPHLGHSLLTFRRFLEEVSGSRHQIHPTQAAPDLRLRKLEALMRRYRYGASALAAVLLAGIVSASSYPVDSSWVAGIYDGGDYDIAALAVSAPEALSSPQSPPTVPPQPSFRLRGVPIPHGTCAGPHSPTLAIRAPPSA